MKSLNVKSVGNGLKKMCLFVCMLFFVQMIFAQGGGAAGIQAAVSEIKSYVSSITSLMYAIGIVVGLIGGVRIYIKWTAGDDINKEIMGYGGAFIFLMVVPTVVNGFFG